jgi:hypothetical protein
MYRYPSCAEASASTRWALPRHESMSLAHWATSEAHGLVGAAGPVNGPVLRVGATALHIPASGEPISEVSGAGLGEVTGTGCRMGLGAGTAACATASTPGLSEGTGVVPPTATVGGAALPFSGKFNNKQTMREAPPPSIQT